MAKLKIPVTIKRPSKQAPKKKVLSTTIGFENYADYYDVYLCENEKAFFSTLKSWLADNNNEKDLPEPAFVAKAMFVGTIQKMLKRGRRKVGALFFINEDNNISHGVVAHECLHAALEHMSALCGYRGSYSDDYFFNNSPEEQLCTKLQELVEGCYRFFKECGVKPKVVKSIYQ